MLIIYTGHSFLIGYSDLPVPHRLSRVKLPCCVFPPSSGPTPWYWLLTLEFTFRVCGPESGFLIPFLSKWSSFFHESQKLWQQCSTGTDLEYFVIYFSLSVSFDLVSHFDFCYSSWFSMLVSDFSGSHGVAPFWWLWSGGLPLWLSGFLQMLKCAFV